MKEGWIKIVAWYIKAIICIANNRRSVKYNINKADFDSRHTRKIEIKAVLILEEDDLEMNQNKL